MLRPYDRHGVHLGHLTPKDRRSENFNFQNCEIAKYLIAKHGTALNFRNGRKTELAEHCLDCPKCLDREILIPANEGSTLIEIKISKDVMSQLNKWIKKNHPECLNNLGEAIRLLTEYFDYAYYTMRPELIRYKQQYGELRK